MDNATKNDISELKVQLSTEMKEFRLEMKEQFAAERIYTQTMVRAEIRSEIGSAFHEFIDGPFSNLVEHVDGLHDKLDDLAGVVRLHSADLAELKAVSHKH